jgi:Sulfate permease family
MAYALIAGVDPRFGLYSAIDFTATAGSFGPSRHLVNGPTGAVRWSLSARSPSSRPTRASTPLGMLTPGSPKVRVFFCSFPAAINKTATRNSAKAISWKKSPAKTDAAMRFVVTGLA